MKPYLYRNRQDRKSMKYKIILFVVILLSMGFTWVYFRYFFNLLGTCGEQVIEEIDSPSHTSIARNVVVNCGATTDYFTKWLLKNKTTGKEEVVLSVKGHQIKTCNMAWDNDVSFKINCKDLITEIYHQVKILDGIAISFTQTSEDK